MKRTLFLRAVVLVLACAGSFDASGQSGGTKVVHVFLAKNKSGTPATTFSADVPTIYLVWKGEQLEVGDQIRAVWIAEEVGDSAPKEFKIGERLVTVLKPNEDGAISLSRPRGRVWPVGGYRTEVYIGKELVQVLRFTIQPGTNVEVH